MVFVGQDDIHLSSDVLGGFGRAVMSLGFWVFTGGPE